MRVCVLVAAVCSLTVLTPLTGAQQAQAVAGNGPLTLETDSPSRFIAAHGRRALIAGYASAALDVWAYPFQVLGGYRVAFREAGVATATDGAEIMRRVIYAPDSVTRIYLGPDFVVREKLFVPLDEPGAILTYSVEGGKALEIDVHATPVLNLMWPAALGGQEVAWNASLPGFVLSEPAYGFSAAVGSAEIVAHDSTENRAMHGAAESGLGFTLRTDSAGVARVLVALNPPHAADRGLLLRKLMSDAARLETEAAAHYREVEENAVQVQTPDEEVNSAFAWAETALDQAWVCNPGLGCGYVAGYGPNRGPRRPQYDWFFAGDGLMAADAALTAGDRAHAREELKFILRYQDSKSGMIWHELSQSAKFLDWAGKYPYMFVHVDITFQFLGSVVRYVVASGDTAFVSENWAALEAAYRYCQSVIDPATGLPRIPPDKEGGDEQDRMTDDLGLSTSWVDAAESFAQLARLSGHAAPADEATRQAARARASIPARYWDEGQSFWISGHNEAGRSMMERRSGPTEALGMRLFSERQNEQLLDEFASSAFETDWGARSVGAGSEGFNPESYSKGSVWPVQTASLAQAYWQAHRPVTALALWRTLLPVARLDSLGHMTEVLAGDFYRPQAESVPEQTWSSAGFIEATMHGLLGLDVDSAARRMVFAPRLPAEWNDVSIARIQIGGAHVRLALDRSGEAMALKIGNDGEPFKLVFTPDLALGAKLKGATFNRQTVAAVIENHPQQTEARVEVTVPHGESELQLDVAGGVRVIPDGTEPRLGEPSAGVRIIDVRLAAGKLTVVADVPADRESHVRIRSAWPAASVSGATVKPMKDGQAEIVFAAERGAAGAYRRARAVVELKP